MSQPLYERHRETLERALQAIRERTYWSPYPEIPSGKIYGETAKADGQAAFEARLNKPFDLDQPATAAMVGDEASPFGPRLGITYPRPDLDALIPAVEQAMDGWKRADIDTRLGVCLEILQRLNQRSFELTFAVMHTTGQGFMMAFQAGGPHAQDHALEAVAYAAEEMRRYPGTVEWEKRVSKTDTVKLAKQYRIVPRGIAANIGCSTFPTWNSYPGLFASLATGNAVIVKPHPGAVLPLAITVEVCRDVLREAGFDPNVVTLAADTADAPITKDLVTRPEVKIVDYTGSSTFGEWIEANAKQAAVFTEKAGVNSVVLDSVEDLKAVTGNLAFTLSLYSGQMCTTSQNIYLPRDGIEVGGQRMSFDDVAGAIVKAVDWFLGEPQRAAEVLGAVQSEATVQRIEQAKAEALQAGGTVLRESAPIQNQTFPEARTRTPLIIRIGADHPEQYMREMFGPIVYIVETDSTGQSIEQAATSARERGAITAAVYSTDDDVLERAGETLSDAGAAVSCNLVGPIYVNQKSAFSDFHVSGVNPAGNATLCNGSFIAPRFSIVQTRTLVPQPAAVAV